MPHLIKKKKKSNSFFTSKYKDHIIDVKLDVEARCPYCDWLCFKGKIGKAGAVEVKCRYCKKMVRFRAM